MTKTINGLTVTTSAAAGDFLPIWRASNGDTRKITKANFMGGVLTGAGTIATGGFTLTVGANSSISGNISGSGTIATAGFTGTLPATGTLVTTAASQTLTSKKIDSIGMNYVSMSNTQIAALTGWTSLNNGFLVVHDLSNGYIGTFQMRGAANVTNEISDPSTKFSHTAGTGTSINVYYLGGTGYVIQNNSGGTIFVGVHAIGT